LAIRHVIPPFAHVGVAARQPHARAGWQNDHPNSGPDLQQINNLVSFFRLWQPIVIYAMATPEEKGHL
jgi:hypothetical protein